MRIMGDGAVLINAKQTLYRQFWLVGIDWRRVIHEDEYVACHIGRGLNFIALDIKHGEKMTLFLEVVHIFGGGVSIFLVYIYSLNAIHVTLFNLFIDGDKWVILWHDFLQAYGLSCLCSKPITFQKVGYLGVKLA